MSARASTSALAAGLLRRHVAGGAEDGAGHGELLIDAGHPDDAEIDEGDAVDGAADEEQVARLEVAVDDAEPVHRAEGGRDAPGELEASSRVNACAGEALGQGLAGEPLHGEVGVAVLRAAVRDVPHHPGTRSVASACASRARRFESCEAGVLEDLEGDDLAGLEIARAEDVAHAAGARELHDLEPAVDDVSRSHCPPSLRIVRPVWELREVHLNGQRFGVTGVLPSGRREAPPPSCNHHRLPRSGAHRHQRARPGQLCSVEAPGGLRSGATRAVRCSAAVHRSAVGRDTRSALRRRATMAMRHTGAAVAAQPLRPVRRWVDQWTGRWPLPPPRRASAGAPALRLPWTASPRCPAGRAWPTRTFSRAPRLFRPGDLGCGGRPM